MKKNKNDDLVEQIENKKPIKEKPEVWFDSGLTQLNLSLSDHPDRAFMGGSIVNIAGHKQTGKTQLDLMILAKAIHSGIDYDFIYDDAEAALTFDIAGNFGSLTKEKLEIKSIDDKNNPCSRTVEDLERNVLKQLDKKKSFIYVIDSLDPLSTDAEIKRHHSVKYLNGGELESSYNMEKAKLLGNTFRLVNKDLKARNSLFIINSQARDNVGFSAMFAKDTRSGGRSIDFYIFYMIWLKVAKTIKEKDLKIGKSVKFSVTKNRNKSQHTPKIGGKLRDGEFTVYDEIGIDDVGTNCKYLIEQGVFAREKKEKEKKEEKKKSISIEKEKKKEGKRFSIDITGDHGLLWEKDIPKWIEENKHQEHLKQLCRDVWIKNEEAVMQYRNPTFPS